MPDNQDKIKLLYDAVSRDYNLGTFDEFKTKMSDSTKRKAFYDGVGAEYNLGTFEEFNNKISAPITTAVAAPIVPPVNKYKKSIDDDRSEFGKTLSGFYNGIIGSFERLGGGLMEAVTQFTPSPYLGALPAPVKMAVAAEGKKGIAKAADVIRSGYTTREEEKAIAGKFDVTNGIGADDFKALASMSGGMAVDMVLGGLTGGASFAVQGFNDGTESYDEAIKNTGLTPDPTARAVFGTTVGVINGVLEKYALDKMFGDGPAFKAVQRKVIADVLKQTAKQPGKVAVNTIEKIADAEIKKLTSGVKAGIKRGLSRAAIEGSTEAIQTSLEEGAKFVTNSIQNGEVFDEKDIINNLRSNIINSAAAGVVFGPTFGLGFDKIVGRRINNDVLNDVANAKTPEDFQRINQELETAFNENNFSQEERDLVMNNARRYAEIKQTLPQDASPEAQVKAIPLIENRISIDNEIQNRKNVIESIDESLREDEQKSISILEDKRSQINDEIREAIAGEQFTYFEENGKYFKKFGEAEPEEISRNRYDLEQIKRGQYATPESEGQIQEGVTEGDIRQRQRAQEGIPQEEAAETDIGYRYIVSEEGEDIPLAALVNKKVRIKGEPAILYRENQRLVARVLGTNRILDIFGTMPEMMNALPEQFDVEVDEPIVTETPTGYRVEGEAMVNRNENPLDAISYDPSGKVMNVVLTNPAGRRRKFRGQAAQDLAYQITLKEALKNEEEFENFLQREYEQELQSAAVQAAAQEQAAPVVEPVPTERPAVPVEPTYGRATPTNVASVVGTKLQRKAVDDANRVVGSISPIVRAMTGNEPSINLHSQNTFTEAVLAAGGTREDSGTRGFYLAKDGTIHINMDNVAPDTVLHEGFHPILDYIEIANPTQINEFFSQLEGIEGAQPFIDAARRDYEGDITQKKEAITSFVAGVANGDVIVNPSNFQKIRDFILNMLNKLGMDVGRPALLNVQNEDDLVKLAKYITEVFERGEAVTTERLGDFTETTPTPDNPIAKSGQLQFQRTIYNQSGIEKAPALDRNEFKVAVDEGRISVVNPYESLKDKFFAITFPDDFFTGEVKFNGETIAYGNGGVFYSARFGKRGDVWAAAGENSANNFTIQGNESLRKNNGEGIVVLSKGEDLKQSTSLEANIAFINTIIKYADSIGELPGVVKGIKSAYTVGRAKSADSIIDSFNQYLAEGRGESGQRMVDAKQAFNVMSSALIKEAGPTITKMFRDMGFEGDTYFNKTQLKKGEYVATTQGLKAMFIDMLQEDFLKGVNNGAVYAALKFNSPIKFEKDLYHPSYPYVIKTVDGSPVRLEVFSKTFNSYGKEGVAVYGQERNKENAFGVATTTKPDFKLDPTFEDNPAQNDLSDNLNKYSALQKPQFQRQYADVVNGFYSPILKKVNEFKQPKASVQKWKEIVGIKSDEAVYSGMSDWLVGKKPDQQLSKEEVLQFMKDNRIEINEVVKGKGGKMSQEQMDDVYNGVREQLAKMDMIEDVDGVRNNPLDVWYKDPTDDNYEALGEFAEERGIDLNFISDAENDGAKYSQYQLPGGENYKEILITLPLSRDKKSFQEWFRDRYGEDWGDTSDFTEGEMNVARQIYRNAFTSEDWAGKQSSDVTKNVFKSSHFDEPNIITHLRMNTRKDADGKKVLFLEEVQSDWGQKGKREGFKSAEKDKELERLREEAAMATFDFNQIEEELDRQYEEKKKEGESRFELRKRDSDFNKLAQQYFPAEQRMMEARKAFDEFQVNNRGEVPNAPYVTNTNAWVKLGLKVALKEAVKQGADRIAWTTGEQQNERYDLSKQVDEIIYTKNNDGTYDIYATKIGETVSQNFNKSASEVEGIVGKDLANEIINGKGQNVEGTNNKSISGDNLKVGGKGMKAFYGDAQTPGIVANVAKAIVKELTGKDGNIVRSYMSIGIQPAIELTSELKKSIKDGMPQFQRVAGAVNVAPLFSTKVTSIEEAKQIQSSDMYSKYRAVNEENAKLFNLAVDSQVDGIGGFDGVSEVTTVVNLTGEFNDIVNYSAIQGALAPEVQEATIAGMYVEAKSKEHNADKYIVGIDNQDAAIKAAQDAGFQNDGYTLLDDNISFFNVFKYPTKGFGVKLINFIKKYQDYGGKITYKKRQAVRSEYIDASRRKEILSRIEKSTVRQGEYRERLLDALKLAQERNDAFLKSKGIQFQKAISKSAKQRLEDAKVVLKKNFNPYGILGKDVKILQEKMSGALKADLATAERNVSNLLALKEKYSGVVSLSDMEAVMTGQAPANSLPADLSSAISEAREHIDTLTEQLIESGVIDDQETIDYYRANKGKYLLRSYESITFKDDAVSSALYGKGLNINNVANKLRNVDQSVVDSALKYLANRARLIDSINWSINEDGTYDIEFRKYDKAQYSEKGLSKEQLAESIGADNANIIIDYNIDRKKVVRRGTLTRFSKDVNKDEQVVKLLNTIYNKNISIAQSEIQARKDANEILSDAESYVTRGLTGSTNVKSLSQRLDEDVLSPEIRALMGEYKDPIYNYYSSIFKISSLASSRNYLNQLRSQGLGRFLFEKGDANRPDNATTPIAAAGSETLAPLNGLYTYPEFAEALKKAEREKATTIESMAGRVRKFKTVYNPATHIKNLIGNMGFAVSNGHWNYAADTFKYIRQIMAGKQTPELLELLDVLNRQGVLNSSVGLNELRSYFDRHEDVNSLLEFIYDKGNKEASAYIKYRGVKANLNKIPRAIEKAYGMEDDVFKLLGFVNEANRYAQVKYSKNYFELNDSQKKVIREQAAEIVKDTYPTFSRVPKFVRRLSKTMFLGNFLSFPVESVRVSYNTLKLAMKEINSGNPKLRNIGMTRLAGTLIYNSLFSTASVYGFMAAKAGLTGMLGFVGGDDEEENDVYQAILNYLAPWTQKKDIYVHKFGDGKLIYSDIGSLDSYSYQKSVWNAFWQNINNDKGFTEAIGKSIYQGIEPFVQLDLFYDNILNVFKNEDRYGNNIYNPEENRLDKTKDIGAYMAKQLGPGVVSAMMKSYEYYDKGDFEKLQSELVSQFGARTYYTDLEKQFKNHIYAETSNGVDARIGFKNRLSNARSIYENAKRRGAKGAELDSKYDEALKAYKAILKEVESDYRAAIKGGVPERNLRMILNKSRLGETDIDVISILNGKYDFNENAYIKK